jgi:hypothetical protein
LPPSTGAWRRGITDDEVWVLAGPGVGAGTGSAVPVSSPRPREVEVRGGEILESDRGAVHAVERGDTSVWCSHCQRYESEASGLCMMCEQGVPHEGADGRRYPTPALRRPAG